MCVIKKSERENALFHVRFLSEEIRRRHSLEPFFFAFFYFMAQEREVHKQVSLCHRSSND